MHPNYSRVKEMTVATGGGGRFWQRKGTGRVQCDSGGGKGAQRPLVQWGEAVTSAARIIYWRKIMSSNEQRNCSSKSVIGSSEVESRVIIFVMKI
jgi:hypothetical protein